MDLLKLADEIIAGRRLTRQDDLTFFLDCDLDALRAGADRGIRPVRGGRADGAGGPRRTRPARARR